MRERLLESKIMSELLKDSRLSDRQLAGALRTSETNIARARSRVAKQLIDGYTIIPKWKEIGFEIIAFTFIKNRKEVYLTSKKCDEAVKKTREWYREHPNVVFASAGEGLGFDGLFVSLHKSYSEFVRFKREHDDELRDTVTDSQSLIVDISPKTILKTFHLKYLAGVE